MNTAFLLMAEFETAAISLSDVAERYFGMKPSTAESKAAIGQFPVPTFRASDSQKSPGMIHIQDLADHLDRQRQKGKELFESMQSRA